MARALGWDLATHSGWALVSEREHRGPNDPEYIVEDSGLIVLPDSPLPEQLAWFGRRVRQVVMAYYSYVDVVVFEAVPATWKGVAQVALQQMMYGVFLSSVAGYSVPVRSVSPTQWQREILDYIPNRRAIRSSTVRQMLKRDSIRQVYLRTGFQTSDDNIADSVGIAIYGLRNARVWAAQMEIAKGEKS